MNIKCDRQNTAQQQHVWVPTVLINTSICESAWIWIWADWSPEIHHNIHPSSKTHYRSLLKWSCWKFQLFLKITQSMCTSSLTQRKSAVPGRFTAFTYSVPQHLCRLLRHISEYSTSERRADCIIMSTMKERISHRILKQLMPRALTSSAPLMCCEMRNEWGVRQVCV